MAIVYRWAENQPDRLPELAADLVRRRVTVISHGRRYSVDPGGEGSDHDDSHRVRRRQDPVERGLVASLARPGGNLTGINFFNAELAAKRLELLRELMPGAARVAVLVNPSNPGNAEFVLKDVRAAAGAMGLHIQVLNASNGREIDAAFANLVRERPEAVFVGPDPAFNNRRKQLCSRRCAIDSPRHMHRVNMPK